MKNFHTLAVDCYPPSARALDTYKPDAVSCCWQCTDGLTVEDAHMAKDKLQDFHMKYVALEMHGAL